MTHDPHDGLEWEAGEQRRLLLLPNAAMPARMAAATVTPWRLGDVSAIGIDADEAFLTPDEARELAATLTALADELAP